MVENLKNDDSLLLKKCLHGICWLSNEVNLARMQAIAKM